MKVQYRKLGSVAEINPRRADLSRNDGELTSFVQMSSVDATLGEISKCEVKPYVTVKNGFTYFRDGDVIFAKITPCMQNGKHALASDLIDGFGFGSTEFHVVRAGCEICPEWIHFFLRRKETLDAAKKTFKGAVGQQRVPTDFLRNIVIPIPPIDDQRRIAARLKAQLAEVEKARSAAEVQHADVRLLESRILRDIFDSFAFASYMRIGDGADTTSGSTPSRGDITFWAPAEVPWVKTGEVAFNVITETEESISRKALDNCSLKLLPPKTVLVAMYGQGKTRGQSAVLEVAATINQACFAILPNDTWLPEFMFFWLKRSYLELRVLSEDRGGNQANLNGALLKNFVVPAPSLNIQRQLIQKVSDALREVNAIGNAVRKTVTEINLLPQKILSEAFGGFND